MTADIHLDAPPRIEPNPSQQFAGDHVTASSLPTASERAAISKFDGLNLNEKMHLSPEDSNTLRTLEVSILKGDLGMVESTLRKFKDNPEAATPLMNVLTKDLEAAGIRASYSVDFPLNAAGKAEKSGMFSMSTANDPLTWRTAESKSMCIYTNPNSTTWADHAVPASDPGRSSPTDFKTPPDLALKEIGAHAAGVLLEKRVGQ